jgi:hypothetical protein
MKMDSTYNMLLDNPSIPLILEIMHARDLCSDKGIASSLLESLINT